MRHRHVHEHDEEEHDVAHDEVLDRHEDDERDHRHRAAHRVVYEAVAEAVERPTSDEHDDEAEAVGWDRHERRADALVAETSDDARQRKDDAVDGDVRREEHDRPGVCPPVGEGGLDLAAGEAFVRARGAVGLVGTDDDLAFGGREERRGRGVGGHEDEGDEAEPGSDAALDDENPPEVHCELDSDSFFGCTYRHPAMPCVPSKLCIAVARRPPNAPVSYLAHIRLMGGLNTLMTY